MAREKQTISRTLLCLFWAVCLFTLIPGAFGSGNPPTGQQSTELARLRAAGIQGDRSQIADLIKNLNAPPHREYVQTSLHALAQLGATEALPSIDAVCLNTSDKDNQVYAKVARARLLAESSSQGISDTRALASVKISRFYQELALTPADLNAALQHNQNPAYQPQPLEVYAAREIADMVYRGNSPNYAKLPGVARLDLHSDSPAALKMRLAAVPLGRRLGTIIQELAHKKKIATEEEFEIQLAADEGLRASHAVADQLVFMDTHRDPLSNLGFVALFRVLERIPDNGQIQLLEKFSHDADGVISYNAQVTYAFVCRGIARVGTVGY